MLMAFGQRAAAEDGMMASWLAGIVPELILAGGVVVLLPLGPFLPARRKGSATWLALLILAAAATASVPLLASPARAVFDGTYAVDPFAVYFKLIAIVTTALVLMTTHGHFRARPHEAEVPTLLVLTCLGLVALAASQDLVLITLFLTLVTVSAYVLVGIAKADTLASEASLKFFLFGSVAAAVMIYGMVLLYGLTGSLNLNEIATRLPAAPAASVALAFVIAGYGFKITLAPFHVWVPDTYQGAPTPITAFLSIGPKAAGLAVLLRTLSVIAPVATEGTWPWQSWVAVLSAVTMSAGNFLALRQTNVKRLLAYSSVAQAGYLLMGIAAYGRDALAVPALLFYLAVYLAMNLAAFFVVSAVGGVLGSDELPHYAGLGRRIPFEALVLGVALLALAGVPPMGSFVGKAMLFGAAMGAGYGWLAAIAAANTALSLFYYARVLEAMYLRVGAEGASTATRATTPRLALTTAAVAIVGTATLAVGIVPQPLLSFVERASVMLRR